MKISFFLVHRDFIPQNNLPLGIAIWRDRLFVTMPRWKDGVPASLTSLPLPPQEVSPAMVPYPNWEAHSSVKNPDCSKLMSVYRLFIDECARLWVLDAGIVNATILPNQVCLPKIVIYDLATDNEIARHELPQEFVKQDSLYTNIIVDVRKGKCGDAYAYVADVWRYGLVVFSLRNNRSWRTTSHLYLPTPEASDYNLHGLNFQWTDGIFGMALAPESATDDERILFYHAMSSFTEYTALTSVLRNETAWTTNTASQSAFTKIGTRGPRGQSSTVGIDNKGVMFFNLVHRDAVGCWDINKPYVPENIGIVEQNETTLFFPNDLKVDNEDRQGVWVISNRLPMYLYSQLNFNEYNFRVMRIGVEDAAANSPCDPSISAIPVDLPQSYAN